MEVIVELIVMLSARLQCFHFIDMSRARKHKVIFECLVMLLLDLVRSTV